MANTKNITVTVEGKKWEDALESAFIKANKKAKIDGFRPGKAPKDVFLKKYGKESLYMDAADIVIDESYHEVLEKNQDLQIVAQPQLNLKSLDEKGVTVEFVLTLKPEVKLGEYKNLKVKKDKVEVTNEEIENTILEMRNRFAENISKEGKLENGDVAIIDFEGYKDGIPFEGGTSKDYSLTIGSNTFIPGFEEKLIGMKKGEEKDINLTFPSDYHSEDLKGKDVVFKVKLNDIKTVVIPELDKNFFEDLGMEGIDSKESLEKQVKENIITHKEMEAENKYLDDLLEAAGKNVTVEIPDAMIDEETHRMIHQYEDNLKMQGLTLEMYYQFTNSDEEALKEQMKEEALKRVTYRLMLEEIAKAEKIEITEDEVNKEAEAIAVKYQMEKDKFLELFGGLDMVKYDLEMRKAIEIIKDNSK